MGENILTQLKLKNKAKSRQPHEVGDTFDNTEEEKLNVSSVEPNTQM